MIALVLAASALSWTDAGTTDRIALQPAADAAITGVGFAATGAWIGAALSVSGMF